MSSDEKTAVVEGFVLQPTDRGGDSLRTFLEWLTEGLFPDDKYWQEFFTDRAIILAEDDFAHLCRESLPVDANIQILDETGVTKDGSLRYTEFLPAETLMYSQLSILSPLSKTMKDEKQYYVDEWENWVQSRPVIQFGADESKGKGITQLCYLKQNGTFLPEENTEQGTAS